jgi:hypothetical protein
MDRFLTSKGLAYFAIGIVAVYFLLHFELLRGVYKELSDEFWR